MKFKVGDILDIKTHLRRKTGIKEWWRVEVHAIEHFLSEDRYALRSHDTGKILKLRESIVERDFELAISAAMQQSSQSQVPWSGKFFVGDQFRYISNGPTSTIYEITACKVNPRGSNEYDLKPINSSGSISGFASEDALLRHYDLVGGPSFKQAGQQWQAQYMQQPPTIQPSKKHPSHNYDVGDQFKMTLATWQGPQDVEIEITAFAQGFSDPHYEAKDLTTGRTGMLFSEDSLNANGTLTGTRSKAKAMGQAFGGGHRVDHSNEKQLFSYSIPDDGRGVELVGTLKPACSHNRKYVNGAGDAKFWVCPDCKADLGDA